MSVDQSARLWRLTHAMGRRFGILRLPILQADHDALKRQPEPDMSGNADPFADSENIPQDDDVDIPEPEQNDDPLYQTVHRRPIQWPWVRFNRWWMQYREWLLMYGYTHYRIARHIRWRGQYLIPFERVQFTDQEQKQYYKDLIERERLGRVMAQEAVIYRRRIVDALTRLGLCYRYARNGRDTLLMGLQEVEIDHMAVGDPNVINFHVGRLPRGVSYTQLLDDNVSTDLTVSCGRPVRVMYNAERGVYIALERAGGTFGIPNFVSFQEMMDNFPPASDGMSLPLGMTRGGKRMYRNLRKMPHALIAGSTGAGKSVGMNAVICAMALRNSWHDVRFVMVDLKDGVELSFYEGLPHMLPVEGVTDNGMIYDADQVDPLFAWLETEIKRRMIQIRGSGDSKHRDIDSYNAHRRANKMYRIIVFCDEWAQIALQAGGAKANDRLAKIAAVARAAGIHIVIATQLPIVKVVPTVIKQNIPAKLCFSCSDQVSSRVIIDTSDAAGLTPSGRYIYKNGIDNFQVQMPFISEQQVQQIVADIIGGKVEVGSKIELSESVSVVDILRFSLDRLDGKLSSRDLFNEFKGRAGKHAIEEIVASLDNTVVEVDGVEYRIVNPKPPRSRFLEKLGPSANEK